jgi:hypothetical protein
MEPKQGFTRSRILGLIGVLWGGAILAMKLFGGAQPTAGGAYGAGQNAGLVMGGLLFVVGLYYLIKG